jgi:hypothetical protein
MEVFEMGNESGKLKGKKDPKHTVIAVAASAPKQSDVIAQIEAAKNVNELRLVVLEVVKLIR